MKKDREAIIGVLRGVVDERTLRLNQRDIVFGLEHYIEGVRSEAIGWALAHACAAMDKGEDPRNSDVPDMLVRARKDLI